MTMGVRLVTPEREVWSGEASMLIARGADGEIGILPGHAPLLMELGVGALRIQTSGDEVTVAVHGGFLHVVSGGGETFVDVLAEQAELGPEIDVDRAERAKERAEQALAGGASDDARAELARATARLRVRGRG
jgi:F-type H+-transporting ATPase subunit epsilon